MDSHVRSSAVDRPLSMTYFFQDYSKTVLFVLAKCFKNPNFLSPSDTDFMAYMYIISKHNLVTVWIIEAHKI